MNKYWLKFFRFIYLLFGIAFILSQLFIGELVYSFIKPNSVFTIIFFIILVFISCVIYFKISKFLANKVRLYIKPLDNFLIKLEENDE